MKNLYFYCEGQTEETFVKNILVPYFVTKNIQCFAIVCRTKEGPNGVYRGGITDYQKVVKEIKRYCGEHSNETITSFIDFYGLNNMPTPSLISTDKYTIISEIEKIFYADVNHPNFIPYISLHEFESLLFSNPNAFDYLNSTAVTKFKEILSTYNNNPELINNSPQTAPSKRIINEISNYAKVLDGSLIAKTITLEEIRNHCKHFSDWIDKLTKI